MSTTTTQPSSSPFHQYQFPHFSIDLNQDHHQQHQYLQQAAAHYFTTSTTSMVLDHHHHHHHQLPTEAASLVQSPSPSPSSLPYHIFLDVEDAAAAPALSLEAGDSSWGPPPTFHHHEVEASDDQTVEAKWVPSSSATNKVRMTKKNNKLTIKTNTSAAAPYSDHGRPKKYTASASASAWDPQKLSNDMSPSTVQLATDGHSNSPLSSSGGGSSAAIASPTTVLRVCADCNTTKTPLWRSGPRGPKSLCNACGIRQRKARRAMAAAAAAAAAAAEGGADLVGNAVPVPPAATTIKLKTGGQKGKNANKHKLAPSTNSHLPFKKRCKFAAAQPRGRKAGASTTTIGSGSSSSKNNNNKLCFDDLVAILSKSSSTFQRMFPNDEKEAAILLMALSYGLVQS